MLPSPPALSVVGVAEPEVPLAHRRASFSGGSETQSAPRGTAKRRQRSAAGGAAGSRSALVVPANRGNGAARTAGREARRRIGEPLEGKTAHASKCESRVNATTTANNAGETVAAD